MRSPKVQMTILFILAMVIGFGSTFFLSGCAYANDGSITAEDPPVKYEVNISIRYNALTPSELAELLKEITIRHKDACKVESNIKKVEDSGWVTISSGTFVLPTNDITEN